MWNIKLVFVLVFLGICVSTECRRLDAFGSEEVLKRISLEGGKDNLLLPGSKRVENFVNSTDLNAFTYFYLFSVLNAEELVASGFGVKPKLKEIGPFRFRTATVVDVNWDTQFQRPSEVKMFIQKKCFYDGNPTFLDEKITTLNVPLAVS